MSVILYDLRGANEEVRFSPFCWAAKLGLLHKGIDFETVAIGFTNKEKHPDQDYGRMPVIKDGDKLIKDSRQILAYLDQAYPDAPLVRTKAEAAAADFFISWMGTYVTPNLAKLMFKRVHGVIQQEDQDYFRSTREKAFGSTLEELAASEEAPKNIETALATLAVPLSTNNFLGGEEPNLSDYLVASFFLWKHCVTDEVLFETPEPVSAWFERILDLFDGYGRKAPRAFAV